MPWYVYKCECGYEYDVIEFGDEINKDHICIKCNKKMQREFTPTSNFILKYNPAKDSVSWGAESYSSTQRNREIKKND